MVQDNSGGSNGVAQVVKERGAEIHVVVVDATEQQQKGGNKLDAEAVAR